MYVKLKLTGDVLMPHNGRLANPLDKWTKAMKELTGKRKKTDEDLIKMMQIEARGGLYETEDGYLGMPTCNVFATIYEGAKAFKLGKMTKQAVRYKDTIEPLLVNGKKVLADKYLSDPKNIDYRLVVVQRSRLMRARPIVRNWETTHTIELNEELMNKRDFIPILKRAGDVGLCDMRPTYGTFKVEVI